MNVRVAEQGDLAQEIMDLIPRVMRSFSSIVRSDEDHLDPAQIRLLGMLSRGPCNLSEIARQHSVSLPTVSKSVSLMEDRGWVSRSRSKQDRRVVLLSLTPDGERAWEQITAALQAKIQARLSTLSPGEIAQLRSGLAVLELVFCAETGFQGGISENGCN
jgi:DNA-binding MarR family transcriptional regulator